MSSILRKFNCQLKTSTPPFVRDYTPYCMNMLQALEQASNKRVDQGELKEITSRYWEFVYTDSGIRYTLTIQMTDEFMNDPGEKGTSSKLAPPRFK